MISANPGEKKIMGGFGSGSGQGGRNTTSDYRALDVRRLQRDGLLTPGHACTTAYLYDHAWVRNVDDGWTRRPQMGNQR